MKINNSKVKLELAMDKDQNQMYSNGKDDEIKNYSNNYISIE